MADKPKTLTSAAGIPVGDNQNALTAGERGPLLIQDRQLFEKHAQFNREREGVMRAGATTVARSTMSPIVLADRWKIRASRNRRSRSPAMRIGMITAKAMTTIRRRMSVAKGLDLPLPKMS